VHIISDHGNEYTLSLREVSNDEDAYFDSKSFISPGDKAAKDRLADLPVFVPASELDKVKQDVAAAKAAEIAEQRQKRPKRKSTGAAIPARCTLTTPGTKARARRLGFSRYAR
jgi:hypothetical protein